MNYQIAIIGSKEAIEGFSLLGVKTVPAQNTEEAVEKIREMKRSSDEVFAIIFITEDLAKDFTQDDEKFFAKDPLPAIIPLPSHHGSTGYSMERLSRIVERAVGSDILK
ncbi:V-type ATP synthase subunit F [Candidatus Peribacteria bacterium]|jgi:V/A-type H+/Na+-transporting ATPase subunit F|nr:V-type ATP synthase subunit F [Candidatus Peribacteria bacterium]MBT4020833.1 V-type ATP synthase subunit F [Candidatus Peribacteria bacterium]MBT4241122.1 V-type ATP synthase subunit F [Candidatus Peribacteria bacterium]MBT4473844.1 V-type ATP synthase subunit F [Candidatus Peribacteria bacterium]